MPRVTIREVGRLGTGLSHQFLEAVTPDTLCSVATAFFFFFLTHPTNVDANFNGLAPAELVGPKASRRHADPQR